MSKFYLPLLKDCLLTELGIPKNFEHVVAYSPEQDNESQVLVIRKTVVFLF